MHAFEYISMNNHLLNITLGFFYDCVFFGSSLRTQAKEEAEKAAQEREELKRRALIPTSDIFKQDPRGFKGFDDTGFPTLDENGAPITEEKKKSLEKERKEHETLVKKYAKKK